VKKKFLKKLPSESNKYSHGTVAILAGSKNYSGAAVLCVGGARLGGSGYINFLYRDRLTRNLILNAYPDVVVKKHMRDVKVDAWVIGSGSPKLPRNFRIPHSKYAVLDAGAMMRAKDIEADFVVITPHEGEARKLGFVIEAGDTGRQDCAQDMAKSFGCIVVLKGKHTLIAAPDGTTLTDKIAGPELATAGTGDVLAGLIGSMLASWNPETLTEVTDVVFKAVTAHAVAAKAAAKELNPITSTDIIQYLHTTMGR
jgi:hydroxyethylthiazole kinase-like uncharacterized protein yjeF